MFPKKENKLRRYNNFAHKDILLHYPAEQLALFRDSHLFVNAPFQEGRNLLCLQKQGSTEPVFLQARNICPKVLQDPIF